ncbi:hypothetical protein R1sor_027244 [Riccia sorocarpa]|uniref:Uncharacterized protein n=1 Tax=Riccia sorocarpa TaxID=122646 RepID=A0ABD3GFC1_9MARC
MSDVQIPGVGGFSELKLDKMRPGAGLQWQKGAFFVMERVKGQDTERYSRQAFEVSLAHGWYADICVWARAWGLPEEHWGEEHTWREHLSQQVVHRL